MVLIISKSKYFRREYLKIYPILFETALDDMPMLCFPRHSDFPLIRPNISDCGVDLFLYTALPFSALRCTALHCAALRCTAETFVLLGCWNNNPWVNPVVTLGAAKPYVTQASLLLTSLQYTALQYTSLQYTALQYTALQYTAMQCTSLQYTALQYTSLQYTALNCTVLHPTAHGKYPLS